MTLMRVYYRYRKGYDTLPFFNQQLITQDLQSNTKMWNMDA
jgi:hypothetical protein